MDLTYPYSPNANWRFAISRRFNLPAVDAIYSDWILPALIGEGLILECRYASEQTEDHDFWMNRINLIFEIADIHILIDIERNPNVEFEFERSAIISRFARARSLSTNFNWAPATERSLIRPITLRIIQGPHNDWHSPRKRQAVLYVSDKADQQDFMRRFKNAVHWAKTRRLQRLIKVKNLYDKRLRFLGIGSSDLEFSLTKMTQLAEKISSRESIDDFAGAIAEEAAAREETVQQLVNKKFEWSVKLKRGEVEIPDKFLDTYRMLRDHHSDNLASVLSPEIAYSRFGRLLMSAACVAQAFKVRRKRYEPKSADPAAATSLDQLTIADVECSFCGRTRMEVFMMVAAAPTYICSVCVPTFIERLSTKVIDSPAGFQCGFCTGALSPTPRLIVEGNASICDKCLDICAKMIADEEQITEQTN